MTTKHKRLEPIHPDAILLEDFMKPKGISINRLARDVAVPPGRISAIVNGKRAITADIALRLGKYFGVSPQTWMGGYRQSTTCESHGARLAMKWKDASTVTLPEPVVGGFPDSVH